MPLTMSEEESDHRTRVRRRVSYVEALENVQ